MAEILDLEAVLQKIDGFDAIGRILLSTTGTLQSTLAALFRTPVAVKVLDQSRDGDTFHREVDLVRSDDGVSVCRAKTTARVEREDIRELLIEERAGIGQILQREHVEATFDLLETGADDDAVWRLYRLAGPGVVFEIHERLPRAAFGEHEL